MVNIKNKNFPAGRSRFCLKFPFLCKDCKSVHFNLSWRKRQVRQSQYSIFDANFSIEIYDKLQKFNVTVSVANLQCSTLLGLFSTKKCTPDQKIKVHGAIQTSGCGKVMCWVCTRKVPKLLLIHSTNIFTRTFLIVF